MNLAELEQTARRLYAEDPTGASRRSAELQGDDTDESRWMRACLLESAGEHAEAASLLRGFWEGSAGEDRARRLIAYARNLLKAKSYSEAWRPLADAVKANPSYRLLRSVEQLLRQHRKLAAPPFKRTAKIALLGTATLDFWVPALKAYAFASGIDAEFYVGPFGQYQQEILDPSSGLAQFAPTIVLIAQGWQSLGLADESSDPEAAVKGVVQNISGLWKQRRTKWNAAVIQCNFEIPLRDPMGRLSASLPGGRGRVLREINLELLRAAGQVQGVVILDVDAVAAEFGKERWSDPVLWHAAKQHPAPDAIPVLARHVTALARAILGLTAKCLVLDLDGTCWGGVIGEDGLSGIVLGGTPAGEAFVAFQKYAKSLGSRGVLLAVCSKNNREDALGPFQQHREMVLKEEDIACFVANWESKDENLRSIAKVLNIGLDSMVLMDDNPAERARIRQNLPEVEVVELGADPAGFIAALDQGLYFETLSLTEEDRKRGESIRKNIERAALETTAGNVDEYLASLGMKVRLRAFDEHDLPRIVQLINKTNQFNVTTRRRTEAEVRAMIEDPNCFTQTLRVEDRFGDSGLTGVLVARLEGSELRIDTWLMSCRVLGRRLDEVMFAALTRYAEGVGAKAIRGEYLPSAKNGVVADLFPKLGFTPAGEGFFLWRGGVYPHPAYIELH